ncbi:MAG: signal peptidase II [Clostridium sp.]
MILELIIVILGFLGDRVTKLWALDSLKGTDGIVIFDSLFKFEYLENRGAAFGILQNKVWFLTLVTTIVVGGIIFYLIKTKPKFKLTRIGFAMIISGALGNFYDRLIYKFVVDFICVHYKDIYYFPTFNVADILVSLGTLAIIICIIKDEI